jgi:hypothetical protein
LGPGFQFLAKRGREGANSPRDLGGLDLRNLEELGTTIRAAEAALNAVSVKPAVP